MFLVITSLRQLDFRKLMDVYEESNALEGKCRYPNRPENLQLIEVEQDFYQFLLDFFRPDGSRYFLWASEGRYKAALRVEPYRDGFLIEGLETAPYCRRRGFAASLLAETINFLNAKSDMKIYSHIHKANIPSIRTHIRCGFVKEFDYAFFVDGSVDHNYLTYVKNAVPK